MLQLVSLPSNKEDKSEEGKGENYGTVLLPISRAVEMATSRLGTTPTSQQAQNRCNVPSVLAVGMHAAYGNSPCVYRDVRYGLYSPI